MLGLKQVDVEIRVIYFNFIAESSTPVTCFLTGNRYEFLNTQGLSVALCIMNVSFIHNACRRKI